MEYHRASGRTARMLDSAPSEDLRLASVALVRALRALDQTNGVRHSGIALDLMLLLYERRGGAVTVKQLCDFSGYTGPTVRLVIARLQKDRSVVGSGRSGRATLYRMSERGVSAFDLYMDTVWSFGQAVASGNLAGFTAAAATIPVPDRQAGRRRPRVRRAAAPPARQAAA
jgi:hypothetical protein